MNDAQRGLERLNASTREARANHAQEAAGMWAEIERTREARAQDLAALKREEEHRRRAVGRQDQPEQPIDPAERPWAKGPDGERHPDLAALAAEMKASATLSGKRQPDNWRADREVAARWARARGLADLDPCYAETAEYQSSREAAKWLAGRPVRWEREAREALEQRREAIREAWPGWLRARARVLAVRAEDQRLRLEEDARYQAHADELEPRLRRLADSHHRASNAERRRIARLPAERADALIAKAGQDPPEESAPCPD